MSFGGDQYSNYLIKIKTILKNNGCVDPIEIVINNEKNSEKPESTVDIDMFRNKLTKEYNKKKRKNDYKIDSSWENLCYEDKEMKIKDYINKKNIEPLISNTILLKLKNNTLKNDIIFYNNDEVIDINRIGLMANKKTTNSAKIKKIFNN